MSFQMIEQPLVKFAEYFSLDPEELGYVEWCSGALRINTNRETWLDLIHNGSGTMHITDPRLALARTFTHERYHFLQFISTGYLYKSVSMLADETMRLIGFPFSSNAELESAIDRFFENPPKPSFRYTKILKDLDEDRDGLTVRSLVESAAFLYEYRSHMPFGDAASYHYEIRRLGTDSVYRAAYDIASVALGEVAFDALPLLTYVALCYEHPVHAFFQLLEYAKTEWFGLTNLRRWAALAIQHVTVPFLGPAAQVAESCKSHGFMQHPEITHNVAMLATAASKGQCDPLILLSNPTTYRDPAMRTILGTVLPPTVLNGVIWFPEPYRPELSFSEKQMQFNSSCLIAYMSSMIAGAGRIFRHSSPYLRK